MNMTPEQNSVLIDIQRELAKVNELVTNEQAYRTTNESANVNDFVAYAVAYAGRAITQVARNRRDGYDSRDARRAMLIKAAGLLVNAAVQAEREDDPMESL